MGEDLDEIRENDRTAVRPVLNYLSPQKIRRASPAWISIALLFANLSAYCVRLDSEPALIARLAVGVVLSLAGIVFGYRARHKAG